jgi:hypothetical protein
MSEHGRLPPQAIAPPRRVGSRKTPKEVKGFLQQNHGKIDQPSYSFVQFTSF